MKETILHIDKLDNFVIFDIEHNSKRLYDGYEIQTSHQTIRFLIKNEQQCCEDWGYLTSEDNMDEFIGAEVISISRTDTACKRYDFPKAKEFDPENETVFINIETDKGTLQFVAYNSHNGYYGHRVYFLSHQMRIDESL